MKYVLGKRRRNDPLKRIVTIVLLSIALSIALDCWFNYGRMTIDLIWNMTDKIDAII